MPRKWPLALGLFLGMLTFWLGQQAGTTPDEGWHMATRWTGRAGFPLLIAAYSASSLVRLWPGELTKALLRDRRWWGLGFAAAHTIHLATLIAYMSITGASVSLLTIIGGGAGYALLYAMAFTSTHAAQRALGRNWKRLHTVGIHFLWFIFAYDFTSLSFGSQRMAFAIPAALVTWTALALRLVARRKSKASPR